MNFVDLLKLLPNGDRVRMRVNDSSWDMVPMEIGNIPWSLMRTYKNSIVLKYYAPGTMTNKDNHYHIIEVDDREYE